MPFGRGNWRVTERRRYHHRVTEIGKNKNVFFLRLLRTLWETLVRLVPPGPCLPPNLYPIRHSEDVLGDGSSARSSAAQATWTSTVARGLHRVVPHTSLEALRAEACAACSMELPEQWNSRAESSKRLARLGTRPRGGSQRPCRTGYPHRMRAAARGSLARSREQLNLERLVSSVGAGSCRRPCRRRPWRQHDDGFDPRFPFPEHVEAVDRAALREEHAIDASPARSSRSRRRGGVDGYPRE